MRIQGFTLIELLVVITIIVVLLSLLAPAMDKAIYQAELAACGAKLKALASSVTVYAFDHRRFYPHRPRASGARSVGAIQHELVILPPNNVPDDLRPRLRDYMSINRTLQCPFTQQIELDNTHPDAQVFPSYQLWFGWQFKDSNDNNKLYPGMLKVGDRIGWYATNEDGATRPVEFDVLGADVFANEQASCQSSHPNYEQTNARAAYQDELFGDVLASRGVEVDADRSLEFGADLRYTTSLYLGEAGTIDRQLSRSDGSVQRDEGVTFDVDGADGRHVYMPWRANAGSFPTKGTFLPRK